MSRNYDNWERIVQAVLKREQYRRLAYASSRGSSSLSSSTVSDDQTSLRIEGINGQFDYICKTLGFSGIDDFGIPVAEYEAMKVRSSVAPCLIGQSHLVFSNNASVKWGEICRNVIKGVRPPFVAPPPSMSLPVIDNECSTWDILQSFAPDGDSSFEREFGSEEDGQETEVVGGWRDDNEENFMRKRMIMTREDNGLISSNDDDFWSTTTELSSNVSPNERFRRISVDWQKGDLLGRGSFGSVYEGITSDGFFFAFKEVSLLGQGDEGKQRIIQLEQEIALLSQFEHENIVQYYGTEKVESHLYIFLELVTKGSLLNLYQKYCLQDSQVSAYTRQILHGLKYLHDKNVVHRDIKCANILVSANGLVKLADFGLTKVTDLNDVISCKGTIFWTAPEVVRRMGYGPAADIWSLGCTVLEMLTGSFPYSNMEPIQALYRIGKGELPPIPISLSSYARDFILQCLQVDASARPTASRLLDHPFVTISSIFELGFSQFWPGDLRKPLR